MWEAGCWEPRDDQLTWQQYELSSQLHHQLQRNNDDREDKTEEEQVTESDELHRLTQTLTTQIVDRRAPLITNAEMDRRLVTTMSGIHWTEQRFVKQRLDNMVMVKRNKRQSVSESGIRQSSISSLLDLKQVGKSIKYMKQTERDSRPRADDESGELVEGSMSGEWELEHSYVCSVCSVEYDDMMEILHHKWEAHPHCLVSHLSVRTNVKQPPDLMMPQVGPSTVTRDPEQVSSSVSTCSKCETRFEQQEQFYNHILECGGVNTSVEPSSSKKKKKKTGAGGLKSTVRMIKKGEDADGNTSDQPVTPRKKPVKTLAPLPLIPTHTRTTRYKETMKKEAKKIAAKERRVKRKMRGSTAETKKIVTQVMEDILNQVEKIGQKKRRRLSVSRRKSRTSRGAAAVESDDPAHGKPSDDVTEEATETPIKTVVVQVSNDDDLETLNDHERLDIVNIIDDAAPDTPKTVPSNQEEEVSSSETLEHNRILRRLQSTLVTSSSTPARARLQHSVEVKMSAISVLEEGGSQEELAADLDIGVTTLSSWWSKRWEIKEEYENKLANKYHEERSPDKPNRPHRPRSLDPKPKSRNLKSARKRRSLKPVSYREEQDILPSSSPEKIRRKKKHKIKAEEINENKDSVQQNVVGEAETNEDDKQETDTTIQASARTRRSNSSVSRSVLSSGWSMRSMPREVKQSAVRRIQSGVSQSEVAKDLDVSLSTVASWWRKRLTLLGEELTKEPLIDDMGILELEKLMSDDGRDDSETASVDSDSSKMTPPVSAQRPQSGLELISSQYCSSSDDEL